jgi:hypothetical protein
MYSYTTDTFVPLLLRNLKEGYNLKRAVHEGVVCILMAQNRDRLWALKLDSLTF